MLSRILITPMAAVLGIGLQGLLWFWRLLGRLRDKVPLLGRFVRWLGYVLTLGCVWIGIITIVVMAIILISSGASPGGAVGALVVLAIGGALTVFLWIRRPRDWPWDPASPTAGRLARENTARNPGRTAVTSAALMIGVALIVFVATFVNGFKDSFLGAIDRSITSDLIIQGQNFGSVPAAAVEAANQVPGVKTASGLQFTEAKINNGGTDVVNGVDPASFSQVYKFDWLNGGSNSQLTNLGSDQALIEEQFAKSHDLVDGRLVHAHRNRRQQAAPGSRRRVQGPQSDDRPDHPVDHVRQVRPGTRTRGSCWSSSTKAPGRPRQAGDHPGAQVLPRAKVQTNAEYKADAESFVNGLCNSSMSCSPCA